MISDTFTYNRHIRDQVCVLGFRETEYTKHGRIGKPEFQLALEAILNACDDAGSDAGPGEIQIGQAVRVACERTADDLVQPRWKLAN